jgi:tRNA(Arg) A34 adenosine deaminase TadA
MKLIDIAAKIALGNSTKNNFRKNSMLAAVAVRKDGAIVISDNNTTAIPNKAAHAESRVLKKAGHGATLYVARVTRNGLWGCAKPCHNCRTMIKNRGVEKVIYTIGPGELGVWYPQQDKNP